MQLKKIESERHNEENERRAETEQERMWYERGEHALFRASEPLTPAPPALGSDPAAHMHSYRSGREHIFPGCTSRKYPLSGITTYRAVGATCFTIAPIESALLRVAIPPADPPVNTNWEARASEYLSSSSEITARTISLPRKCHLESPAPWTAPAERLPAWESDEQ
jgi:hypothetical protein